MFDQFVIFSSFILSFILILSILSIANSACFNNFFSKNKIIHFSLILFSIFTLLFLIVSFLPNFLFKSISNIILPGLFLAVSSHLIFISMIKFSFNRYQIIVSNFKKHLFVFFIYLFSLILMFIAIYFQSLFFSKVLHFSINILIKFSVLFSVFALCFNDKFQFDSIKDEIKIQSDEIKKTQDEFNDSLLKKNNEIQNE